VPLGGPDSSCLMEKPIRCRSSVPQALLGPPGACPAPVVLCAGRPRSVFPGRLCGENAPIAGSVSASWTAPRVFCARAPVVACGHWPRPVFPGRLGGENAPNAGSALAFRPPLACVLRCRRQPFCVPRCTAGGEPPVARRWMVVASLGRTIGITGNNILRSTVNAPPTVPRTPKIRREPRRAIGAAR